MRRANYHVVVKTDAYMVLRDVGPWSRYPTITNDAERVLEDLRPILGGRRLFYYDSEGELTEICYDLGRFVRFGTAAQLPGEKR